MTLEQLRHFLAAARHLNFTHAAEELYIHPTSVSRSVAALEEELGVILFVRDRKVLLLSEAGRYLSDRVAALLTELSAAEKETRRIHQGIRGKLSIRGFRFYIKHLTPVYRLFRECYPNVELSVTELIEEDVVDSERMLLSGEMDLGLIFYRPSDEPNGRIERRKVFSDHMDIIAAPNHRLALRESIGIADLSGETLLLRTDMDPVTGGLVNRELERRGLPLMAAQAQAQRAQTESEWLMQVSAGFGVSFMPRSPAKYSLWDIAVLPVADLEVRFDLYLACLRDNTNPALRLFLDLLAKQPINTLNGGETR